MEIEEIIITKNREKILLALYFILVLGKHDLQSFRCHLFTKNRQEALIQDGSVGES